MKPRPLTKLERYGILGLVLLIGIYFIVKNFIIQTSNTPEYTVELRDQNETIIDSSHTDFVESNEWQKSASIKSTNYKPFYPDSLTRIEWRKFDFSEKQVDVILNFKESSGGFYKSEDLKKIYIISDEKFAEMEPFMLFSDYSTHIEKFELNSATEEELKSIKGIGDVLATRIKKYQKVIGGFSTYKDLESVYGLEDEVIQDIIKSTTLQPKEIEKVNVNDASKKELLNLPHMNFEIVSLILKERDKKRLKNLEFLSEELINDEEKEELNLYLEFK